jgi:hypothetical protein
VACWPQWRRTSLLTAQDGDCGCCESVHLGQDINANYLVDRGVVVGKVASGSEADFEYPPFGAADER